MKGLLLKNGLQHMIHLQGSESGQSSNMHNYMNQSSQLKLTVEHCIARAPSHQQYSLFCFPTSDKFAIICLIKQREHVAATKNKSPPIAHLHVLY